MKKSVKWVVCGILLTGFVGVAYAQFAKPEDAIEYRKAVMFLMGQHFGRIAAVIQGKTPYDPKAVAQDANLVDTLSKLPWEAFFMPGADKGRTHLKPLALKEKEDFKADAEANMEATAKLAQVAAGGDLKAIKAQFGAVGKTCKACHDKYRSH